MATSIEEPLAQLNGLKLNDEPGLSNSIALAADVNNANGVDATSSSSEMSTPTTGKGNGMSQSPVCLRLACV